MKGKVPLREHENLRLNPRTQIRAVCGHRHPRSTQNLEERQAEPQGSLVIDSAAETQTYKFSETRCDVKSWLSAWPNLESTNPKQLAQLWGVFLDWIICGRRPTLNLLATYKKKKRRRKLLLLACLPSVCWQVHLACCGGIPWLVSESSSSGFQHTLKPADTLSLVNWATTGFLSFPPGDSHCCTSETTACKSL